jgi:hypothetical protein
MRKILRLSADVRVLVEASNPAGNQRFRPNWRMAI